MKKFKPTKEQLKVIKEAWKQLMKDEDAFYSLVNINEKWMEQETGIKGIEFIRDRHFGGDFIGVGNIDRTMELIQHDELQIKDKK